MLREHNEFSIETIFRICHELKKNNKTICFTHGGFDLFHYGHLYLLRESAKICDYLIVGVEQDTHLTEYKSYTRPVIGEKKRFEIVSELNCVNQVFINRLPMTDKAYEYLYKELKADIITIGRNFGFKDKITQRAEKMKIKLMQFQDDYESTSRIVKRIINQAKNFPEIPI